MATLNEQMDSLIEENSKLKNDLNRSNSILNEILTSSLYKDEKIRKLEKENLELKKKVEFFNNNPTQLNSNFDLNDYSQASENNNDTLNAFAAISNGNMISNNELQKTTQNNCHHQQDISNKNNKSNLEKILARKKRNKIIKRAIRTSLSRNSNFYSKSVEYVNSMILKEYPIMISEDIDCNNCKIRRNYDSFLKEIISKLTFNQHDLHYEKDKRNIINDYTVRFYFTCVHPECESKFFLLINLIKNKASLFSNINNGLMSHHLNSSLNTKKIEDHDYCKIILQKTKAKRQHYSVWSDFKKVSDEYVVYDEQNNYKKQLKNLLDYRFGSKWVNYNQVSKIDKNTIFYTFRCAKYSKTKCQVICRAKVNLETCEVSVYLNNHVHNCMKDSIKIELIDY